MKKIFYKLLIGGALLLFSTFAFAELDNEQNKKADKKTGFVRHMDLRKIQKVFNKSFETENVKNYKYDKNRIYKIPLREYMHSVIRLPDAERLKNGFVLGDTENFHFNKIDENTFEVWGEHPGADTSLTVFGQSGNIYSFYLKNYSVESTQLPDLTVYISGRIEVKECKDCEKSETPVKQAEKLSADYLRELTRTDPTKHDYNYTIGKGNQDLKPLRVFDDGFFTYFQFAEKNLDSVELPDVYAVINGFDTPVQTRVQNGFLIATTINEKWTVRNGVKFLCVRKIKK